MRRIPKIKPQWMALAALFPFWGIGSLQLLVNSANRLTYSCENSQSLAANPAVSFCVALTFLTGGLALTLQAIWMHQAERIPRLDLLCGEGEHQNADCDDYDSPSKLKTRVTDEVSYTRLWYLSFQNHLLAKSGFDTMKLTPLKKWPAILKTEPMDHIVPVWNLPLVLATLVAIPASAIFIAAFDVIFHAFVGFSFCQVCLQLVEAVAVAVSFVVCSFPVPMAIVTVATAAIFIVPRLTAAIRQMKMHQLNMQAAYSEMVLSAGLADSSPKAHLADNHDCDAVN